MAEESQATSEKKSGGMLSKLIVWAVVFVLGVGTGVSVPLLILPAQSRAANPDQVRLPGQMDIPAPDDKQAFIDFDEIVVNLNDARYSRYVTCTFSLQVAQSQQMAIAKLIDDKKVVLKNWLIAHLRDKQLDDVRGMLGHNTLRREIRDHFNQILFTDGIERVQDVLFQDLKVQ